jgi:type VI secretion system secreted protein VgrG
MVSLKNLGGLVNLGLLVIDAFQTLHYHGDPEFIDEEHWHTLSPSRNLTTGAVTYRDHSYVAPDATFEIGRNEPRLNRANERVNHGNFEQ